MSSDEPTTGTTNPRRRILWLVVAHVVVGLMGAFVAYFAGRWSYAAGSGLCRHRVQSDKSVGNLGRSWIKSVVEKTDRCCCRCRLSRPPVGSRHFRTRPQHFPVGGRSHDDFGCCRCCLSVFSELPFAWILQRLLRWDEFSSPSVT